MNFFVNQGFDVTTGLNVVALPFPNGDVRKLVVIALRFAFLLVFRAEVTTARFLALEGIEREEFGVAPR